MIIVISTQQIRLQASEQAIEVQNIAGEMIELKQIYKLTQADKDLIAKIEKIKKIGEILA